MNAIHPLSRHQKRRTRAHVRALAGMEPELSVVSLVACWALCAFVGVGSVVWYVAALVR